MSIATDEAGQWAQSRYIGSSHIERHDGHAVSVPNYPQKVRLRAEGYVAGRTAEPTEAEIEAAAIAAYKYYFDSRCNTITLEIAKHDVQRFNGSTDEFSDPDVNYARNIATVVLTAARKAVTE